jgi:hypothetical protein
VQGRDRVRTFLLGGEADRPPFLAFASGLAARLAQRSRDELLSDPQSLTQAHLDAVAVCGFECVLLDPGDRPVLEAQRGAVPGGGEALRVLAEAEERLRVLLGESAALGVVLPGPLALASQLGRPPEVDELESLGSTILGVFQSLRPPLVDLVVVREGSVREDQVAEIGAALAPLWNAARYYSMPSLFLAARAGVAVASVGADAVAVGEGAAPEELALAGAKRVGVPVDPERGSLPPLPPGGFYLTAGEIPPDTDVSVVQELVRRAWASS